MQSDLSPINTTCLIKFWNFSLKFLQWYSKFKKKITMKSWWKFHTKYLNLYEKWSIYLSQNWLYIWIPELFLITIRYIYWYLSKSSKIKFTALERRQKKSQNAIIVSILLDHKNFRYHIFAATLFSIKFKIRWYYFSWSLVDLFLELPYNHINITKV